MFPDYSEYRNPFQFVDIVRIKRTKKPGSKRGYRHRHNSGGVKRRRFGNFSPVKPINSMRGFYL